MTLEFDLESKHERNMKVLQSIHRGVSKIMEDVPYIAVYEFDTENTAWKRLGVEGSAFVTADSDGSEKSGNGRHSFIVLNKKGPDDLVLDLSTVLNIKIQDVYLMIRCSSPTTPSILAFWFHQAQDLNKIYHSLSAIVNGTVASGSWKDGNHLLQSLKIGGSSGSSSLTDNGSSGKSKGNALLKLIQSPPAAGESSSNGAPTSEVALKSAAAAKSALLLEALKPKQAMVITSAEPTVVSAPAAAKKLLSVLKSGGDTAMSAAETATAVINREAEQMDSFLDCDIAAKTAKPQGNRASSTAVMSENLAKAKGNFLLSALKNCPDSELAAATSPARMSSSEGIENNTKKETSVNALKQLLQISKHASTTSTSAAAPAPASISKHASTTSTSTSAAAPAPAPASTPTVRNECPSSPPANSSTSATEGMSSPYARLMMPMSRSSPITVAPAGPVAPPSGPVAASVCTSAPALAAPSAKVKLFSPSDLGLF